jgi:hypothetical protein
MQRGLLIDKEGVEEQKTMHFSGKWFYKTPFQLEVFIRVYDCFCARLFNKTDTNLKEILGISN